MANPPAQMLNVVDESGNHVGQVDAAEAAQLGHGFRVATPEENLAILDSDRASIATQAGAVATGALKGATLGVSDIAIAELGGRDTLQFYERQHGAARTVGEVAGGTAALFLPGGGAGLLARGARAVSAPARFALRAGQAVEGSVAATRAGRLAGMAAGGAIEGAFYGAGEAASEAAIYNRELTGEHLLSSIGYSALLSGGAAFGLGAAGRLLGKAGEHAGSLLTRAMKSADGQPGTFAKVLGAISDVSAGAPVGTTAKYLADPDLVRLAQNAPEEIAKHEARALDALERVQGSLERYRQLYSGGMKSAEVGRKVATGNEAATLEAARGFADQMADTFARIKAADGVANVGKKLRDDLAALRGAIADAAVNKGPGANARVFMALDDFKRQLGRKAYGKLGAGKGGAQGQLYKALDQAYDGPNGVRKLLENDSLWGDAAKMQAAVNEAWTPFIQKGFETGIPGRIGAKYSGPKGLDARRFDRKGAAGLIRNLDAPENAQIKEFLREFMEDGKRFADVARKNRSTLGGHGADDLAGAFDEVAESMGRVSEARRAAEELGKLQQLDSQGGVAAGALGYMVGGLGGAGAVAVLGQLRSPYGLVTKWTAAQTLAEAASTKLAKGTAGLFDMAVPSARVSAQAADRPKDPRPAAAKATERVDYIAKNRDAIAAELADGLAGLSEAAPGAAEVAVARTMAAHDHLAAVAPRGHKGKPPPREEARRFMQRVRALEDPGTMMRDIARGRVSPAAMETLRVTRPAIWADMRMQAVEQFAALEDKGQRLPYAQRVRLGLVFSLPTDGTLDPGTVGVIQASYVASAEMANEQAEGTGKGPNHVPDMADAFRTDSERLRRDADAA